MPVDHNGCYMQGVTTVMQREHKAIKAEVRGLVVVLEKLMQKMKVHNLHQKILKRNSSECQE